MAKIFADQVKIIMGSGSNQKEVLAIFDEDHNILWEAPRKPNNIFYKIGSTATSQKSFDTEVCKFNSSTSLNHTFDHTKLIPQPSDSVWVAGTVTIDSSTMTFKPWNSNGTYTYTVPYSMRNFKPEAVWRDDKWYYSDGNTQYQYIDTDGVNFEVATHLDGDGNPFTPDPSQMWMLKGVLHQGNNYKRTHINGVGYRWVSSGIQTISGFSAEHIWTDGENTFYGTNRILNKSTLNWDSFTMNVQVPVSSIWTDGRYLYANMTNGSPSTYLKWDRYNKKWVEISTTQLIYTISSMNYLWTDRRPQTDAHGGYGFHTPSIFTGFKVNGRYTTFTMQYKI